VNKIKCHDGDDDYDDDDDVHAVMRFFDSLNDENCWLSVSKIF